MFKLALASLWNRRASAIITVFAIAVSVVLLLGVERVREQTRSNFANTVSGTDLIIGGRTGQTQLLLASVFHIGQLSNTLSWESYEYLSDLPETRWHVPIALGDSVAGYPVVGTQPSFFEHFKYGHQQSLEFVSGQPFDGITDVVLGAQVARGLKLAIGETTTLSHGSGGLSFSDHSAHEFSVVGILKATGTPVDKAVYTNLAGLSLVHGELTDDEAHDSHSHADHEHADTHAPATSLSAVLLGLNAKPLALRLQRQINTYSGEPLTAIMPGQTLQQLWQTLSLFEQALLAISSLVVITGLLTMLISLLSSLRERRREMAVLRAVGARPWMIFALLQAEALVLTIIGCALGMTVLALGTGALGPWLQAHYGIVIAFGGITLNDLEWLAAIVVASLLLSSLPAWRAYRNSLADGLTIRL